MHLEGIVQKLFPKKITTFKNKAIPNHRQKHLRDIKNIPFESVHCYLITVGEYPPNPITFQNY